MLRLWVRFLVRILCKVKEKLVPHRVSETSIPLP